MVSQPRNGRRNAEESAAVDFSISESDSNVHSMMHQLFKTNDELLEHRETF